jgi:glutaredoxin 3
VLQLYQAEWCPYSHRVRERLTELNLDFVARQVEPKRDQRAAMREAVGSDAIPVLLTEENEAIVGDDDILEFLDRRYGRGAWATGHQDQEQRHPPLRQGASRVG